MKGKVPKFQTPEMKNYFFKVNSQHNKLFLQNVLINQKLFTLLVGMKARELCLFNSLCVTQNSLLFRGGRINTFNEFRQPKKILK